MLLGNMFADRRFAVYTGIVHSRWRTINNGLPQGSVLVPRLFNLYVHDLPVFQAEKFQYADDIAFGTQSKHIKNGENVLTKDLHSLAEYCAEWRLGLNPVKTETSAFHLNSQMAKAKIHVKLNGKDLPFNSTPKYLRVVLDRTLTYEENSEKNSSKGKDKSEPYRSPCRYSVRSKDRIHQDCYTDTSLLSRRILLPSLVG